MATTADAPPQKSGCWEELDALYACATPKHQFEAIYRIGEFDDCRKLSAAMWACMRGGEARRRAEAAAAGGDEVSAPTAPPVWELKATPRWEYDGGAAGAPAAASPADAAPESPRRRGLFRWLTTGAPPPK